MNAGRWRLRRLRPKGVGPLEVWDLPAEGKELWEILGVPRLDAMRREGRGDDAIGPVMGASLASAIADLRHGYRFEILFVGGGLLELPGLEAAVRRAGLPVSVSFSSDRAFVAEAGGRALLRENGGPDGIVVDVGQTSIKLSACGVRRVRERDFETLPLRLIGTPRPRVTAAGTAVFAGFIADAIAELLAAASPRDPLLVLALPCPLGDDLAPGACTYGWEGHDALLPEAFRILDERFRPWPNAPRPEALVLNDAELAAVSARAVLAPAAGTRVLVLTLGFGPGGALLGDSVPASEEPDAERTNVRPGRTTVNRGEA